ncbi:MAG: NYN domain-containing protein [Candidatus Omnitrophota bacterium]|nr:NYN domain-containing protein [Candidatus Omnitrophota bacterium]
MSLHYLLDGYNIVKQVPSLKNRNLKASRDNLSSFIEANQPQGSSRNKITVVFDGKVDIGPFPGHSYIEIIFSKGRSADEEIKHIVGSIKNRACVVVVTDDRNLKLDVRAMGTGIMSVNEFLSKPKTRIKKTEEGKDIPFDVEYKINSELRNLWLKPKK